MAWPLSRSDATSPRGTARRAIGAGLVAVSGLLSPFTPAVAHPHVWVKVETTVLYSNGTITGLRHTWTFDEFYTAMAIQGLDTNKDGIYSREELAELAKVNVDGLKDFDYFTHVRLGDQRLELVEPKDYWLEHGKGARPAGQPLKPPAADGSAPAAVAQPAPSPAAPSPGIFTRLGEALFGKRKPSDPAGALSPDAPVEQLSLHFTVPLKQPVLAEAPDFSFSISDASFFIALDLAEGTPVKLGEGAPSNCRIDMTDTRDSRSLGDAFAQQFGAAPAGFGASRPIKINCGPRT